MALVSTCLFSASSSYQGRHYNIADVSLKVSPCLSALSQLVLVDSTLKCCNNNLYTCKYWLRGHVTFRVNTSKPTKLLLILRKYTEL